MPTENPPNGGIRTRLLVGAVLMMGAACAARTPRAKAVVPPPAEAPIQDPPALLVAQTVLELPAPQPVPAEAVAKRELPAIAPAPADAAAAHPAVHRRTAEPSGDAARDPSHEAGPEVPAEPVAQPPSHAASRPSLVPADPNGPSVDTIQKRIARVEALDARIRGKAMTEDVKMIHNRIRYFLDQAARALERKDLREADSLSNRARVLAEDVLGVR